MATQDAPLPSLQKTSAGASANAREKGRHYYANNRESELARQREMYVSLLDEQGQPTTVGGAALGSSSRRPGCVAAPTIGSQQAAGPKMDLNSFSAESNVTRRRRPGG